jgi:SAM-dependent methyltransferase
MAAEDVAEDAYRRAIARLETLDLALALAARVVETLHPAAADIANPILEYAAHRFPDRDVVADYARRARGLATLQAKFEADPRAETLGDPDASIERDLYNIALLLSIPLTNHRFEIMAQLDAFVAECTGAGGRIASIGTGTGYELTRLARLPPGWTIESYDIEESVQADARALLDDFGIRRPVVWGREFPLVSPATPCRDRYDALVLCELLEHLPDPAAALSSVRARLAAGGRAFVTMAINIAQEDHVYLYPDIASCRDQLRESGLRTISEWITPQTTLPPGRDRERNFRKGNYLAVAAA